MTAGGGYHLSRLSLTAFRNYDALRLVCQAPPVVLFGPNGSGKTNILEAISLFAPGRGLRRASQTELQQIGASSSWAVVAEVTGPNGFATLATGGDNSSGGLPRRLVRVDGKPMKNQAAFTPHLALNWITPDLDRVLAESPSARRKLIDRLVYGFDPAHAARVARYEENLRERTRLLKDGVADAAWLNALEDAMAQSGVAVAAARLQMTQQLNQQMDAVHPPFPAARLTLDGWAETALLTQPAVLVEEGLRGQWAARRHADAQAGGCGLGPHRTDLGVMHVPKHMPAALCSTGEQKALLISVVMAQAQLLRQWRGVAPLLLLDDLPAHLDDSRRVALMDWLCSLGGQFWMTGTDRDAFAPLAGQAQFFQLRDGRLALA